MSQTPTDLAPVPQDDARRRRRKGLLLSGGAVALVAVGGTAAYAFWTSGGEGFGSARAETAKDLQISVLDVTNDLNPGGTGTLGVNVTNPNDFAVSFSGIAGTATGFVPVTSDDAHLGCTTNVAAIKVVGSKSLLTSPVQIPAGGTSAFRFAQALTMENLPTNQDVCQGAAMKLTVSAVNPAAVQAAAVTPTPSPAASFAQ